jgi:GTPase
MLIDEVKIEAIAGNGGTGAVAFDKNKLALGPAGASGGRGGDIYFVGISNLGALSQFRFKKIIKATNGMNGRPQYNDGQDGESLVLNIPVGTIIHNLSTGQDVEITKINEKILVARGGRGGKGNFHFKSATNTSPTEFEEGRPGQIFDLRLELKLIADVGFVGLPNIGKSSLLNEITNARTKVANYPFTTLEPNLGVYYDIILADIPGLIKGAAKGKGLGIKFLRHVERTEILFHFISSESKSPVTDYKTIRKELERYNKKLLKKKEYLIISKTDVLEPKEIKNKISDLAKKLKIPKTKIFPVSIYDFDSVENIKKLLNKISDKKTL